MEHEFRYVKIPSEFGTVFIVWRRDASGKVLVSRIIIPENGKPGYDVLTNIFNNPVEKSCPEIDAFSAELSRALQGLPVKIDLEILDWDVCTPFQRRVMLEEYKIPRGKTLSYGELAQIAGGKRYSRAVGSVQARNPFPIIIPCHRVIRSDGSIGNYGGGVQMKRRLLELERSSE